MSYEDVLRYIDCFKPNVHPSVVKNLTDVVKSATGGQKVYVTTARDWRDHDSLLGICYAGAALEEDLWKTISPLPYKKPVKFVSISDERAGVRGREWKDILVDEGDWVYRFVNGQDIGMFYLEPEPINIELSFSELMDEE